MAVRAVLLTGCLAFAGAASGEPTPLWVMDLRVVADESLDLDRPLRVKLYSSAPEKLAAGLPGVVSTADDHLIVDVVGAPVLSRGIPGAPEPSFVIDYDTEVVAKLVDQLRGAAAGKTPSDGQLVAFVREQIEPSHSRGFDIASRVATHRSGDCTEHAVLLAALARGVGLPAHVATGTVVVYDGGQVGAFGHAWTEIHRDGRWQLLDATPLGDDVPVSYLPEGLLEDEGPGYMLSFLGSIVSGIVRIEVLGNAPDAGS